MRYLLIALALLTTMMSNAQETNTTEKANSKKIETKYDKYVSNYGTFLRFAEYNMPKLNLQGDWINETKIREFIDVNTGKKDYFVRIRSGYPYNVESIAYSDLEKILDAISKLKQTFSEDSQVGNYLEFRFTSEDGMQIGYYYSDNKPTWFITIDGNTRYFKKDFDFEQAFKDMASKIEELMKH